MVWVATHWECSVCRKPIPKDEIYIDSKTDELICKDCLDKQVEAKEIENGKGSGLLPPS